MTETNLAEVAQLEAHLQHHLCGQIHDLRLVLREDGLVLQGSARTYYAKQLAQHAVLATRTFNLAANDIQVVSRAGGALVSSYA